MDTFNHQEGVTLARIQACRVCRSIKLELVLDLGTTAFTGVFPSSADEIVDHGSLAVLVCTDCGLAQLADSFPAEILYGDNYGYRSGLNASMVSHLRRTANRLEQRSGLMSGDVVLDIGANDGTLLRSFTTKDLVRVGIDPTIAKFREFYDESIIVREDFFSAESYKQTINADAALVTSIAMFYDLEDPVAFAKDIASILRDGGLWYFEQSYMPWMLRSGAYDTICHEHLEYYSLTNIRDIIERAGLELVDATTNAVNGGSISVTARKGQSSEPSSVVADWLIQQEQRQEVHSLAAWSQFGSRVADRQRDLLDLLTSLKRRGMSVMALGASTKGNVLLQTSGIGQDLIRAVGDVNPDKFGRFLPGTGIPILSEEEVLKEDPDYLLVLPWHFRETFMKNLHPFLSRGGRLIFPLPDIEVVGF